MSSGVFTRARYEASYGAGTQIHPIRVQPETLTATSDNGANPDIINITAPGAVNNPISALSGLTRRAKGLRPRFVTCRWVSGIPAGYDATGAIRIVCLTEQFYNAAVVGRQITYLGGIVEVVSQDPERAT